MYKHVAKQRRLASHNKEAHLSDEDSSGDEEEQQELELGSNASDLNSEGSEGSDDDDDEMLLPSDDEQQEAEEEDDGQLQPPPPGYPTAAAALEMPIVDTALAGGEEKLAEDDEAPLICVVCPTKVLKKGKMLEVHLGSKDHKRRLKRFTEHITNPDFPEEDAEMDARLVSAQIDRLVLARLSLQTQLGGSGASAPSTSNLTAAPAPTEEESKALAELSKKDRLAKEAEEEGISKRQLLRELKHKKVAAQRLAKKEKAERLRRRAEKAGEPVPKPIKSLPKKPRYVAPKPTKEEIEARQAMKKAKREAEAAAGLPIATAGERAAAGKAERKGKEEQGKVKKQEQPVVPKDVVELKKEGKVGSHGEKKEDSHSPVKAAKSKSKKSKPAPAAVVKEGPPIVDVGAGGEKMDVDTPALASAVSGEEKAGEKRKRERTEAKKSKKKAVKA